MKIGNVNFDVENHTYIMGILNRTPDSFSDGGKYNHSIDITLERVKQMIEEGCDIIDIGGESTRPGYTMVSIEEEIDRIVPIITAIKKQFSIPISVDTYKSAVAKAAIQAGCDLINDIWGLQHDKDMARIIKEANVACCLMHNRKNTEYHNFLDDIKQDLKNTILYAKKAGIDSEKIILDPGIGFAKNYEQNMEVLANLHQFHELGYPLLLGASKKSVIGLTLNTDVSQRLEGTLATTALALQQHYGFVRVHDIKENKRVVQMLEEIRRYQHG